MQLERPALETESPQPSMSSPDILLQDAVVLCLSLQFHGDLQSSSGGQLLPTQSQYQLPCTSSQLHLAPNSRISESVSFWESFFSPKSFYMQKALRSERARLAVQRIGSDWNLDTPPLENVKAPPMVGLYTWEKSSNFQHYYCFQTLNPTKVQYIQFESKQFPCQTSSY